MCLVCYSSSAVPASGSALACSLSVFPGGRSSASSSRRSCSGIRSRPRVGWGSGRWRCVSSVASTSSARSSSRARSSQALTAAIPPVSAPRSDAGSDAAPIQATPFDDGPVIRLILLYGTPPRSVVVTWAYSVFVFENVLLFEKKPQVKMGSKVRASSAPYHANTVGLR